MCCLLLVGCLLCVDVLQLLCVVVMRVVRMSMSLRVVVCCVVFVVCCVLRAGCW